MEQKLTKRECEVMDLVKEGYSSKEIAELLHITYNTVKQHIVNIYTKLGARNKAHAVALHYIFHLTGD